MKVPSWEQIKHMLSNLSLKLRSEISDVQETADSAKAAAEEAGSTASSAQAAADAASVKADTAIATANEAKSESSEAKEAASEAKSIANTASSKADAATKTANQASVDAFDASNYSQAASKLAEDAMNIASTAEGTAKEAKSAASQATSTANEAKNTANVANTNSSEAKATADEAKATADEAKSESSAAVQEAQSASSTAQSATQTAGNALTKAEEAIDAAAVADAKAEEALAREMETLLVKFDQGICDRTIAEITEAAANKICLGVDNGGRYYTYIGLRHAKSDTSQSGSRYPTFVLPSIYNDITHTFETRYAQLLEDKKMTIYVSESSKVVNPNTLTFTGAVTGTYDGSSPLTVNIPTEGGGVGSQDMFVIKVREFGSYDWRCDVTRAQFDAAMQSNKACIATFQGKLYTQAGYNPSLGNKLEPIFISLETASGKITGFSSITLLEGDKETYSPFVSSYSLKAPSPKSLTFTGAVEAIYDGSEAVTINIPDGGSGTGLPEPEGPNLQLVTDSMGQWTQEERTHYDVTGVGLVQPQTTLTVNDVDDGGIYCDTPLPHQPIVGETYTISWNGATYECVAYSIEEGFSMTVLGNLSYIGEGDDTGEPFVIAIPEDYAVPIVGCHYAIMPLDESTTVEISITGPIQELKRIDQKYLPEYIYGYADDEDSQVIPETILLLDESMSGFAITNPLLEDVVIGRTYKVTFNGVVYECKAELMAVGEASLIMMGDTGSINGESNGLPFLLGVFSDAQVAEGSPYAAVEVVDESLSSITLKVERKGGGIRRIDPIFLPEYLYGYEDYGAELLPETVLESINDEGMYIEAPLSFKVQDGETYIVKWNGTSYECVAWTIYDNDGNQTGLGNLGAITGSGDTGEPFVIGFLPDEIAAATGQYAQIVPLDGSLTVRLSIIGRGGIRKIDPIFLPERTHWVNEEEIIILPEITLRDDDGVIITTPCVNIPEVGVEYTVRWNGTEYRCVAQSAVYSDIPCILFGNGESYGGVKTDDFFSIVLFKNGYNNVYGVIWGAPYQQEFTLEILDPEGAVHTLDPKFLPEELLEDLSVISENASNAYALATTANAEASAAKANASTAISRAAEAKALADAAKTESTNAQNSAANAQTTANVAKSTAEEAKALAEEAKALSGNAYIVTMELVSGSIHVDHYSEDIYQAYQDGQFVAAYYNGVAINLQYASEEKCVFGQITSREGDNGNLILTNTTYTVGTNYVSLDEHEFVTSVEGTQFLTKNNPIATGSFSLGRKADTNTGLNSIAIGDNGEASNSCAVSFGSRTVASGTNSFAHGVGSQSTAPCSFSNGISNTVSNSCSAAFGHSNRVSGSNSFAEGFMGTITADYCHTEGCECSASGKYGHSEGYRSIAAADYAHAEGCNTAARSQYQHVQGKWNIQDYVNKYAHIVGNGYFDSEQNSNVLSNAHTLDWDGNGWYAGNLYVGGTSQNDGVRVLTENDIQSIVQQVISAMEAR